jgi:hypothetical protein
MRFKEMGSFKVLTTIISGGPVVGGTALQDGKSRSRFPMMSLKLFIPAALYPGVDQLLTENNNNNNNNNKFIKPLT